MGKKFRIESNEDGTNLRPKNSLSPYLDAPPAILSCLWFMCLEIHNASHGCECNGIGKWRVLGTDDTWPH